MDAAFAKAYDENADRVFAFLAYRVRTRADAEDLTQRTFERALRGWREFDPGRAPVGIWLLAIARNLVIDHYRADPSQRHQPLEEVAEERLGVEAPEPDLGIDPALAAALTELSPREREVLALRYGGDLTGPEIAGMTGLSLANVQQIVSRSLRRLRASLEGATSVAGG